MIRALLLAQSLPFPCRCPQKRRTKWEVLCAGWKTILKKEIALLEQHIAAAPPGPPEWDVFDSDEPPLLSGLVSESDHSSDDDNSPDLVEQPGVDDGW